MAKPTAEDIRKLEFAHKVQFVDLAMANRLWLQFLKKLPKDASGKAIKTSRQYIALVAYGKKIADLVGKWYARQYRIEAAGGKDVPKFPKEVLNYFAKPADEIKLLEFAKGYIKSGSIKGLGIIPLIIWGVIALIGAFTVTQVVDELNTTAEEKQDLLKATEKTLKELNVTGPEAAAIISQTQKEASESGGLLGGMMPKLLIAGGLIFLLLQLKNKKNGKDK